MQLLVWQRLQRYGYGLLALGIAVFVVGIRQLGGLQGLELKLFDSYVRHYATARPSETVAEVVVVGITEADIRHYNDWPLSDSTIANLLERLQTYRPAAIGLDIYRDIDYPPGSKQLAQQLAMDNVYGVYDVGLDPDRNTPAPRGMAPERVGFADFVADTDGVVRRNFMFGAVGEERFYSLGLRLSLHVLGERGGQDSFKADAAGLTVAGTFFPTLAPTAGGYQTEDMAGYQVMLQYRTNHSAIQYVSLGDVLDNRVNARWFKDKVVLVGTIAPSVKDTVYTPLNTQRSAIPITPGVFVHAHATSQILSAVRGDYGLIWGWTQGQETLWIAVWCLVGSALAWHLQRVILLILTSAIALLILGGIGWSLFAYGGWIPVLPPMLGFFLSVVSTIAYQVFYRTFYDPLTSLPNRALSLKRLQHHLNQYSAAAPQVALLLLDLDRFKAVNESFGVSVADRLLQVVARRILQQLPGALVARVGSDQFAVVLPWVTHAQAAIATTERLQKSLKTAVDIQEQRMVTTISTGIALHSKGQGYRAHELLQDAHRALCQAKQLGRNRYRLFDEAMRTRSIQQFQLEMELRHAGDNQQFQLYYQPIIDLGSGNIAGFEALIRWQHPERGMVPPNEFIDIAEDTGLILAMGRWILNEACCQLRQWQQLFPRETPLFISVNLSSRQFIQPELANMIAAIVHHHRVNPRGLKLELTESVAMEDVEAAIDQLIRLKDKGLHISLDDFGTGYSSLSYLHRFPIDSLKIDKSFVDRMESIGENADIVGTIVTLGHRLRLDIIAEGVETPEQAHLLKQLQCQYAQGYLFSKPLPEVQATRLLEQWRLWPTDG
ncbi:MAG: EAL domain-containing protein [Cyanobacteria bacterium P01_A01_bin.15]